MSEEKLNDKDCKIPDTEKKQGEDYATVEKKIREILDSINSDAEPECSKDLEGFLRSILNHMADKAISIDSLDLEAFKKFLEKNKSSIEDALAQSSLALTTITPEAVEGLQALAFMIPGAAIMCFIVVSAAGAATFINYNLTTKDAEIIPLTENELTEKEEKAALEACLSKAIASSPEAQKEKENLTASLEKGSSSEQKTIRKDTKEHIISL